jgi:hypothetical protein
MFSPNLAVQVGAYVGCLVLIRCCIAFAEGLIVLGISTGRRTWSFRHLHLADVDGGGDRLAVS